MNYVLVAPVPPIDGLTELIEVTHAWAIYQEQRRLYEEGEPVDQIPVKPAIGLSELASRYPRAAVWYNAYEFYCNSDAFIASIGEKAMKSIEAEENPETVSRRMKETYQNYWCAKICTTAA